MRIRRVSLLTTNVDAFTLKGLPHCPHTIVISVHGAKGLEFIHVLLMGVVKNILPRAIRRRYERAARAYCPTPGSPAPR